MKPTTSWGSDSSIS